MEAPVSLPTAKDVDEAARRLAGVALHTPLLTSAALDAMTGGRVFLKAETLQRTGSFKFRGAYNRLAAIPPEQRAGGVVAFSSGNHAQGVAAAARLLGMRCVIVMPSDAPEPNLSGRRRLAPKSCFTIAPATIARRSPAKSRRAAAPSSCRLTTTH